VRQGNQKYHESLAYICCGTGFLLKSYIKK